MSFSLPERVDVWELAQKPNLMQIPSLSTGILMLKISSIGIRAFLGLEEFFFFFTLINSIWTSVAYLKNELQKLFKLEVVKFSSKLQI